MDGDVRRGEVGESDGERGGSTRILGWRRGNDMDEHEVEQGMYCVHWRTRTRTRARTRSMCVVVGGNRSEEIFHLPCRCVVWCEEGRYLLHSTCLMEYDTYLGSYGKREAGGRQEAGRRQVEGRRYP